MHPICSRLMLVAGAAAILAGLGGCSRVRTHQGYQIDKLVVDSISPGVDNKASVEGALGRPSFASQFGPEEWYYVSRDMRQLAFKQPRVVDQTILRVRFDAAGNVSTIDRIGKEQVANIGPVKDKTETLGRQRTLFQDIFGNIGAVGAGGMGGGGGPGSGGQGGAGGSGQ
ncbi:MAG TPA: outer membrane protein assembly factor BamE [Sphingobium sp.]|uniref:outer membrane protein assembly factor BamE n=1 Tax=Sphingobium sp. TaxID=1912891 RepID=UPI002ECFF0B1